MPLVASLGGYVFLGSPVSRLEILLSIISLFGVLLVASPDVLLLAGTTEVAAKEFDVVDVASRIWAVCIGLVGVCGSGAAFLCMSSIGKTERPLTVVNYLAAFCTLVSCVALIALPGLSFQLPGSVWEWGLLFFSGLSGFLMVSCINLNMTAIDMLTETSNSSSQCPCKLRNRSSPSTWYTLRSCSPWHSTPWYSTLYRTLSLSQAAV